jgi:hypothetical protein
MSTVNSETAEDILKRCKVEAVKSKALQTINNLKTIESMLKKYKATKVHSEQNKSEKCVVS